MSRSEHDRVDALVEGATPTDERERALQGIVRELRGGAPRAPESLRTQVEGLSHTGTAQFRRPWLQPRRLLLAAGSGLAAVVVGIAVIGGIAGNDSAEFSALTSNGRTSADPGTGEPALPSARRGLRSVTDGAEVPEAAPKLSTDSRQLAPNAKAPSASSAGVGASTLPPSRRRTQDYRVDLRLRVQDQDELSEATAEALRLTRNYGGYVVAVDYAAPGEQGDASLDLRVPIGRVQQAVVDLSQLGKIVGQEVSIKDLQGPIDSYSREILRRKERVAKLGARLDDPSLTAAERRSLQAQLATARRVLADLRADRAGLIRQGRFAKVALRLTTREGSTAAPGKPGRLERAARDAASVLEKELAIGLYILIVVAPFAALGAGALYAARAARRRGDERLLENA